ncbi:iron-containing alcohol dehydrogenase [Rhodococcus rhodochrous]|uniref:Iron-containing alcohol dehydrogenase n=1 Tax=Rhodococcus rhodochrous TaxID=1829 RepID=A0AAW4XKY8_RHORH|nr:iron-containing alcohol dehydrogenase [Rhodococcus rhodochrous]KLL97433.1 alcohol dehydrogenase [Rhodococcus sp. IITR03]MCD2113810.1 iron-containing alcohol dehydrogenase [Rhodococcus rhodochrous]QHG85160.1 iron-containing alcohol dehydrogenase [Rhodococcus rhodochrous]QOH59036.1 alcohol dehydrogenase [Rhodococcus rhodochrous]
MRVGGGAVDEIGEVVAGLGLARPLVVTDKFLVGTGAVDRMVAQLEAAGLQPAVFAETVPDPTTASLEAGVAAVAEHDADCVIGFGGGSPMDTAKALGLLARQGGHMRDYKAPRDNIGPALPVIAVPTTAGSGSEATQFTVISDSETDEKMLCPGLAFLPVAAIVDYRLTLTMPPRLTADTGVDALTHAIEAYVSRKANPFSDSLALVAIGTIGQVLRRVYADGQDAEARERMMLAATQAGIAFSNSSVALVHGMSRPIGAHFHVAHGLSNAMLFPAVTEFSVDAAESRYADCARALGATSADASDATAAADLVVALKELCRDVEVPTPKSYGIDKQTWDERVPVMAEQALASGSPNNNPRIPTADEIRELYGRIYA